MHKSWGNAIDLDDALERMGADTMRWLYCSQNPAQELRFGYGLAEEVKRRFLTFWNSVKFFVDYANIVGFRPSWPPEPPEGDLASLDRWLVERTHAFVHARPTAAYDAYDTVGLTREWESFVDDLSNWYIRRSRRRFWDGDDEAAFATLWYALVQPLRVLAPILPFVADHLWRTLVLDGPESVHLAGWPEVAEPDDGARSTRSRRCGASSSSAGRRARPRASSCGSRCAGSSSRARRLDGHVEEIADELRVKEVELGDGRGDPASGEAEPAEARPEARQGARRRARGARGGRVRGAARRPLPGGGTRARAGRGARRARRARGLGGRLAATA